MKIDILVTSDCHGYLGYESQSFISISKKSDLILDNGDFHIGSTIGSMDAVIGTDFIIETALETSYTAMNVGNHDLDYGIEFLKKQQEKYNLPIICGNLMDNDGSRFFPPFIFKEVKGVQVGIIAIAGETYHGLVDNYDSKDYKVVNKEEVFEELLPILKEKCDLIIALYHGGLNENPITGEMYSYPSKDDEGSLIFKKYEDIDILVCGHQHIVRTIKEDKRVIVQPGPHYSSACRILVDINEKEISNNRILDINTELIDLKKLGNKKEL